MSKGRIFGLWTLTLLVLVGTVVAANWQYNRHISRSEFASNVKVQLDKAPSSWRVSNSYKTWKKIKISGNFSEESILVRNRPLEGRNGFWIVNNFNEVNGSQIPVLVGWIPAKNSALEIVNLPRLPDAPLEIVGVIRDFEIGVNPDDLPINQASTLNQQLFDSATNYFIHMTSSSLFDDPAIQFVPVPNITNGPHLFYAIQWLVFGLIAIIGSIMLTRNELNVKS